MNDILGILIPMLMSGAGIGDILRAIGGAGQGAASSDGLMRMMSSSLYNARMSGLQTHNEKMQKTIDSAAENLVDRLGIVPTSGLGQGLTSLFGGLYHLSPDTFGTILGVPNGGQFFSTVANASSGINRAAGFGAADIFNPYSVMESHNRTMSIARKVYEMGVRENGGYNIDFGHGLNMREMGLVTQRLLSSDIAYTDENGNRLDPESDKFKDNLKKLGSKFNEAASMLSKVTGSIEEALSVMDRLGGGNFLGGTAEQASAIANKAKNMATAIRVTSAVAGISPQEMYSNIMGLQGGMSAGMGLNPYIAEASGFNNLMQDMAFNGTMAYTTWAAMNPDASPAEKQQALFVANGRAQSYATSNGASLAAAVADNASLFTPEELERFKTSFREGRPNEMVNLIKERIGAGMFNEYMTDSALQVAARKRAAEENPELLESIDQAGQEGNLAQAERFGANRMIRKTISDIGSEMTRLTGKSGFTNDVDEAAKTFLRNKAVENGLTEEAAGKMNQDELRRFLRSRPGMDEGELNRQENVARLDEAKRRIDSLTMDSKESYDAGMRLKQQIMSSSRFSEAAKQEYVNRIDNGEDLNRIYSEFSGGMSAKDARELRENVFAGRMTAAEAERAKARLDRVGRTQDANYTNEERMRAIENDVRRSGLEKMGALKSEVVNLSRGDFGKLDGRAAMARFTDRAVELAKSGTISLAGDSDMSKTYSEAARRVVSDVMGNKFGDLEGEDLDKLKSDMAQKMLSGMKSGKTIQEAFADAKEGLTDDQKKILDKTVTDKNLSNEAFFSAAASVIDSRTKNSRGAALEEMKKLSRGDFGKLDGRAAVERFAELSRSIGVFTGSDEEFSKFKEDAVGSIGKDATPEDAKKAIGGMLGTLRPRGTRDVGFYATAAAGDKNQAALVMAASMAKMAGLDMSRLRLMPGMEDLVSQIDAISADSTMNRIPNALNVGGASFTKEAVETTKSQVVELSKILRGNKDIDAGTIAAMSGSGKEAEEARERVENTLKGAGRSDVKYDMALIEAVNESKIGGVKGSEALFDEKKMAEARKGEGADADFANVTKQAGRKDSDSYELLKMIGDFTRTIAPFVQDPSAVFRNMPTIPVKIEEGSVPINAVGG